MPDDVERGGTKGVTRETRYPICESATRVLKKVAAYDGKGSHEISENDAALLSGFSLA